MIVKKNEQLNKYVTIKMGGIAENFYIPESVSELINLVKKIEEYYIISGGSNILMNDKKIFKNVISMSKVNLQIELLSDDKIFVGASVRIQKVIKTLNKWGLGGFEFLYSLPAMMGGIIYMNAGRGSDKKSISDFIYSVKVFDKKTFQISEILNENCQFDYRKSLFQNNQYIILGATLKMNKIDLETSKKEINKRINHVKEKQDMRYPNFGSVFKNSNSKIMKIICFFSKFKIKKGIVYSDKSINWFINCGNGNFKEAINLINITKYIHKLFKKKCEVEVVIWE